MIQPDYRAFLEAKAALAGPMGLPCDLSEVHSLLLPHQRAIVAWDRFNARVGEKARRVANSE